MKKKVPKKAAKSKSKKVSAPKAKKIKKTSGIPLAVVSVSGGICMLEMSKSKKDKKLFLSWSIDGLEFITDSKEVNLFDGKGKPVKLAECSDFSLSRTKSSYVLTYFRELGKKKERKLVVSKSSDLYSWTEKGEIQTDDIGRTTVAYRNETDDFDLYTCGLFVRQHTSKTLSVWRNSPGLLFTSRNNHFDSEKISLIGSATVEDGTLVMYDASVEHESKVLLQVGAVLVDKKNHRHIIWRSPGPIWQGVVHAKSQSLPLSPLGFVPLNNHHYIYWLTNDGDIVVSVVPLMFRELEDAKYHPKVLTRFHGNPILEPIHHHDWEAEGTFNPAVIEDDEGVIHVLYRAVGRDGVSRVGHAKSKDGKKFDYRTTYPVFEPGMGFGMPDPAKITGPVGYHPAIYTSGGGWAGSEDPRTVKIGKKIYMTYVAFEGWNSIRIALTSITLEDFKKGNWKWKKPVHLSPPGEVHKNWLLFPEKINGKYAVLHSIVPKISVDYINDRDNINEYIDSPRKWGPQPGRKNAWDEFLRGGGPPPIKTQIGWLLLYHALEKNDHGRYKLGAMILDSKDPTKVLYRSKHPILSPDMDYENNGKPGVIYASGAIIRGEDLYIYYGGADKVVCVATTPLEKFLNYLVTGSAKDFHLNKA